MSTSTPPNQAQKDALGQVVLFQAADATHHVGNLLGEGELPKTSNVHVLHFAGGDACLAGWRQHKALESRLRTNRDRLEWQKNNVSHVSFQCQQSTDQVSDYCYFNRELC